MATDSELNVINVFESVGSYNNNAGSVGENELSVIKIPAVLVETWVSGTNWYRKYSDGWIEQGGYVWVAMYGSANITLHKAMASSTYSVVIGSTGGSESTCRVNTGQTNTAFSIYRHYTGGGKGDGYCYWEASGYCA